MAAKAVIEELIDPPTPVAIGEIAEFLSDFVRSGGLDQPRPEDSRAETWVRRMDWWWARNPYCVPGRPRALVLRSCDGPIVGFHGFIPHDYIVRDQIVPGLGTTTFFVTPQYRGQSLQMFLRSERYSREYHMVDGTPSVEMRRILDRFGYQRTTTQTLYHLFLAHRRWSPRGVALRLASAVFRRKTRWRPGALGMRLIVDPGEIRSVAVADDDLLRRRVTADAVRWFCESGSERRNFIGVCDAQGCLLAYVVCMARKARAYSYGRVLEYGSFVPAVIHVADLLAYVADRPEEGMIPADFDLLVWAQLNSGSGHEFPLRVTRPSAIYFKVPPALPPVRKFVLASEADVALL